MNQINFKKPNDIQKPLKIRFDWFLTKINRRYEVKEDNFLRYLNIHRLRLLLLFGDQLYLRDNELNYRNYSLQEFRDNGIIRSKKQLEDEITKLENRGLIQTKDDLIAFNYQYNRKRYVKLPHKLTELVLKRKIKTSVAKVLFAILLLLYSDLSNQKSVYDMGTKKKKITTKQLKKLTGKSKPTIRRSIRKLEKKNIIIYTARNGKHDGNLFEIAYDNSNKISKKKKQKKSKNRKKKKNKQNDFYSEYGIV
jgi:predicted transcriptional regulator